MGLKSPHAFEHEKHFLWKVKLHSSLFKYFHNFVFATTIFKKIKAKHFNIFSLGFPYIQNSAIETHSTVSKLLLHFVTVFSKTFTETRSNGIENKMHPTAFPIFFFSFHFHLRLDAFCKCQKTWTFECIRVPFERHFSGTLKCVLRYLVPFCPTSHGRYLP